MARIGTRQYCARRAWRESAGRKFAIEVSVIANQIPIPIPARVACFNVPPVCNGRCDYVSSGNIVLVFQKCKSIFCLEKVSSLAQLVKNYKETRGVHSFKLGKEGIGALVTPVHRVFLNPFQQFRRLFCSGRQRCGACTGAARIIKDGVGIESSAFLASVGDKVFFTVSKRHDGFCGCGLELENLFNFYYT